MMYHYAMCSVIEPPSYVQYRYESINLSLYDFDTFGRFCISTRHLRIWDAHAHTDVEHLSIWDARLIVKAARGLIAFMIWYP